MKYFDKKYRKSRGLINKVNQNACDQLVKQINNKITPEHESLKL